MGIALGSAHALDQRVDGEAAGDFAGRGAAHAIAHDKGAGIKAIPVGIFIGGAYDASVSAGGGVKLG